MHKTLDDSLDIFKNVTDLLIMSTKMDNIMSIVIKLHIEVISAEIAL